MSSDPKSYLDLMKPEDISIAHCWTLYAGYVLPAGASAAQREDMRCAFYAGFHECFKVMNDLTDGLSEEQVARVLDGIYKEGRAFFEEMMAKHGPPAP